MLAAFIFAATLDAATLARADVHDCMQRVLKDGGYGRLPIEGAAFLIANRDAFECRMWPRSPGFHSQEWRARVPENAVAIIHSHPAHLPDPSWADMQLAKRLRLPIFVVTPRHVTHTE